MKLPDGYGIVETGTVELGDLILDGTAPGWHEPYIMWFGIDVSEFKSVARRAKAGTI